MKPIRILLFIPDRFSQIKLIRIVSLLLICSSRILLVRVSTQGRYYTLPDPLGLVHTSDRIGNGVGIRSAKSVMIQCKSKRGIGSVVGCSTESESEGSEGFLFLPIPLLLPSLPSCRFTLYQNFLPIPTPLTTLLPSLPSLVWTSPYRSTAPYFRTCRVICALIVLRLKLLCCVFF